MISSPENGLHARVSMAAGAFSSARRYTSLSTTPHEIVNKFKINYPDYSSETCIADDLAKMDVPSARQFSEVISAVLQRDLGPIKEEHKVAIQLVTAGCRYFNVPNIRNNVIFVAGDHWIAHMFNLIDVDGLYLSVFDTPTSQDYFDLLLINTRRAMTCESLQSVAHEFFHAGNHRALATTLLRPSEFSLFRILNEADTENISSVLAAQLMFFLSLVYPTLLLQDHGYGPDLIEAHRTIGDLIEYSPYLSREGYTIYDAYFPTVRTYEFEKAVFDAVLEFGSFNEACLSLHGFLTQGKSTRLRAFLGDLWKPIVSITKRFCTNDIKRGLPLLYYSALATISTALHSANPQKQLVLASLLLESLYQKELAELAGNPKDRPIWLYNMKQDCYLWMFSSTICSLAELFDVHDSSSNISDLLKRGLIDSFKAFFPYYLFISNPLVRFSFIPTHENLALLINYSLEDWPQCPSYREAHKRIHPLFSHFNTRNERPFERPFLPYIFSHWPDRTSNQDVAFHNTIKSIYSAMLCIQLLRNLPETLLSMEIVDSDAVLRALKLEPFFCEHLDLDWFNNEFLCKAFGPVK